MEDLSTMCVGDALFSYNGARSARWTTTGQSVGEVVRAEPALQSFLAEQRIGRLRPASPVRVATGVNDTLVPHAQSRRLAVDWCAKGAKVTYDAVLLPGVGNDLLNHVSPLLADQGKALGWLTDRLEGEPAGSDCRTLPARP